MRSKLIAKLTKPSSKPALKPGPDTKPGDIPISRAKGQKITPEEIRELRDLIRHRYALDVEIWSLRDVKTYQRDVVLDRMRKSDAALGKIRTTVMSWDRPEYFQSEREYQKLQEIRVRVLEGGKREWGRHPPWEETEAA
ncbi:hypothetical protein CC78DRAFT_31450 [Lojkania enalia]|uniref:Rhodanese domain-containing protein n=1 Tax=Lojkania enalia TaxID=147567 RepID=A0A9P4KGT6_9PLEO|nr:hypothetical protein CC78DRAFT_31450 [Didymosphaeria enalia]